jgi:hypothetical protein
MGLPWVPLVVLKPTPWLSPRCLLTPINMLVDQTQQALEQQVLQVKVPMHIT